MLLETYRPRTLAEYAARHVVPARGGRDSTPCGEVSETSSRPGRGRTPTKAVPGTDPGHRVRGFHVSATTDSEGRTGWLGAGRAARSSHRRAVARQAASVLLGYPDERFFERLPLVARAAAELPRGAVRTALLEFCEHASSTPEPELCRHYAEVFDIRRRHALRMTYYADGPALTDVRRVYAEAGWQVPTHELPDHLAVLLEFAARGDSDAGHDLVLRFRSGLEVLAAALREHGTPYARVVDAVFLTLPSQGGEHWEAARRLAAPAPAGEGTGPEGNGEGTVAEMPGGRVPPPREPRQESQHGPEPAPTAPRRTLNKE